MRLHYVLLLNLVLAATWPALQEDGGPNDFAFGFAGSFLILALIYRDYGRRMLSAIAFLVFLVIAIVKSSLQVAALILSPRPPLDQGIVAIPLEAESSVEIAALATAITLTPGTLSVDLGRDAAGQRVLFVHNLVIGDPDAMRREIKDEFEQRILRATRGDSSKREASGQTGNRE